MKKMILLLVAFCCVSAAWTMEPIQVGIKAGIQGQSANMNIVENLQHLSSFSSSGKIGYHFGAMARLSLKTLYFQPELVYGIGRFAMDGAGQTSSNYNMQTLEVPVLVGAKIAFARIFAGPSFNLMTETKVKNGTLNDFNTRFRRSVAGFQVGAGVEFVGITLDVRYGGQFKKPIQELSLGGVINDVRTGMNAWQINVGYFF